MKEYKEYKSLAAKLKYESKKFKDLKKINITFC